MELLRKMSPKRGDDHGLEAVVERAPTRRAPGSSRRRSWARPRGCVAPACSARLSTKSGSSRHSENRPAPKPVRSTRFSQSDGMIWSVSTSVRSRGTAVLGDDADGFHRLAPTGLRGSAKWPATAVAAATAGETRWVRPPRPWRPSKLRFEVEAARSPGASLSGFMARHIEQPGSRHSAPAAVKTLSRPSASACSFTRPEPGTTSMRTPGLDRAARRARRRRPAGPRCGCWCRSR